MKRSALALLAGIAAWVLAVSILNRGLRAGFPGYAAVEPTMSFTLGMKLARLLIGALASLTAGTVTAVTSGARTRVPWLLGAVLLIAFIPIHIELWAKFPIWYHLLFLGTLVPIVALGAALVPSRFCHVPASTA